MQLIIFVALQGNSWMVYCFFKENWKTNSSVFVSFFGNIPTVAILIDSDTDLILQIKLKQSEAKYIHQW